MSQPDPIPNGTTPIWELVVEDMKARDQLGRKRYGTPLQAFNGRNSLQDLYEEQLDQIAYTKAKIIEDEHARDEVGKVMYHLRMNANQPINNPAYYEMLYERLKRAGFVEYVGDD